MDISCIKKNIKEKLIKEIENLSEDDLKKIDSDTHEVKIKIEKIRKNDRRKIELAEDVMKAYEKKLFNIPSREEGIEFLSSTLKDRSSTECFAKFMYVSFLKQDNKDYIINKIVEATIGAKLRSIAIKGEQ
jgi:tRNA A37 N6-isopentenylltransferase MiaA